MSEQFGEMSKKETDFDLPLPEKKEDINRKCEVVKKTSGRVDVTEYFLRANIITIKKEALKIVKNIKEIETMWANFDMGTREKYLSKDVPIKTLIHRTRVRTENKTEKAQASRAWEEFLLPLCKVIRHWELNTPLESTTIFQVLEALNKKAQDALRECEDALREVKESKTKNE